MVGVAVLSLMVPGPVCPTPTITCLCWPPSTTVILPVAGNIGRWRPFNCVALCLVGSLRQGSDDSRVTAARLAGWLDDHGLQAGAIE